METRSDLYPAALQLVRERSNYDRGYITAPRSEPGGPERGLHRTRALLDTLGSPDRCYPIVHVAGSKGKGSTSAFAAAIGMAAGYRTGLSTSPHLHTFRERIAIDGIPIERAVFAALAFEVEDAIARLSADRPELGLVTAFEMLTVMALLAFAQQGCDLAVVEVGLGGTYDATNVIIPAVSVITRLDLEHTQILGDSIESIAANKAGIIAPGVPTVTARQHANALAVIEAIAARQGSALLIDGRDFETRGTWRQFEWRSPQRTIEHLRSGMAGSHQMENAALAVAAWQQLDAARFPASDDSIRAGLAAASLPGRFECVTVDRRIWILDGAHTPVAATALADEILEEFGEAICAIVGLLNDKHPEPFFEALAPAVARLIVTEPRNPRALPAGELIPIARTAISQVTTSSDLDNALHDARAWTDDGEPILISGSLMLIAEARTLLALADSVADPSEA